MRASKKKVDVHLLTQLFGLENFAPHSDFKVVYDFVASKLRDIMVPVLARENVNGASSPRLRGT